MTSLEPITGEEFQSKIALQKADAIVNVTSAWNGAGHMMRPMLEELATSYAGKMKFYTLDYDRDRALSGIYNVTTLPTFLFFQKGTLVDKVAGLINKSDMSVKIQSLIQPTI